MSLIQPKKLSQESRNRLLNSTMTFIEKLPDSPERNSIQRSITKKLRPLSRDPSLASKAREKFWQTESACANTNRRIKNALFSNKFFTHHEVLHLAARKIERVLGRFPVTEMLDRARFGPGSTYGCRGFDVSRARKFSLTDVTPDFLKIARGLLCEYPLWAAALTDTDGEPVCPMLTPVPGGRFTTVPKDSSTDRSIMVEPTINSWFQQGIGRCIRERLRRVGIDLDDQSLNQNLARLGSLTDDIATVDLSSASDLISTELVEFLLPADWFFWLDLTRSKFVWIEDKWVKLEKFSSMGNGFTFDLESLIFYALAWAVTVVEGYNPFWVVTFGDDIVVPSGVEGLLYRVFSDVGFEINKEKSFFRGPFRESCGKDFHLGKDVRGVYIKDFVTDLDLMRVHNRMYEWALRTGIDWTPLRRIFLRELSHIRARVPPSVGDLGVFSSFDEAHPRVSRQGWEQYEWISLNPVLKTRERRDRFLLLDRLQGSDFDRNSSCLRTDPIGYRYSKVWA